LQDQDGGSDIRAPETQKGQCYEKIQEVETVHIMNEYGTKVNAKLKLSL